MADQHWVRVVGFLQPPPAREVLYTPAYYRPGSLPARGSSPSFRSGAALAERGVAGPSAAEQPAEITLGDRLIYFALGPFVVYAVGTATGGPEPHPTDPLRRIVEVKTDVFINTVLRTPHLGGIVLPSGRDLRLLVQHYNYIWLWPEDGQALVERVQTKAGAKDYSLPSNVCLTAQPV